MTNKKVEDLLIETLAARGVSVVSTPGDVSLGDTVEQEPHLDFPLPKAIGCPTEEEIATQNPNFSRMAEGAGLLGLIAETPAKVRPMVAQAWWHDGAALGEVLVSRQDLSTPPTITAEQVKGFGLFTLNVLLNGRGDEINDLAKINILR
jgi:hypothetical protein